MTRVLKNIPWKSAVTYGTEARAILHSAAPWFDAIPLPGKTTLTIGAFVLSLAVMDYLPVLKDYKVMDWRSIPGILDFKERKPSVEPAEIQARAQPEAPREERQAAHPVTDPKRNLERFYQALHRVEGRQADARVRILHYGDSPTTADMITSDARDLMQKTFGDAGHGFCLIAKPWAWYSHSGLDISSEGWNIDPANGGSVKDGMFGIGGVTFRGWTGAFSRIRMRDAKHRHVEVAYLKHSAGGRFQLEVAGKSLGTVDTAAPKDSSGFAGFDLPEGAREFTIRNTGGLVRLFGVVLDSGNSGVVYNSLGINGAYVSVLARLFDQSHWREQLQHYRPDLVIVNYGTNESSYADFVDRASERELREVIRRLREALPEAAILIMSPMDRGQRMGSGGIGTMPTIPRIVAIQEKVALDTGCAFFNTFAAMGGAGTMGRWYESEPRLVGADFIHPMPAGARIVGGLLYQGIFHGYNKYKMRLLENRRLMASTR